MRATLKVAVCAVVAGTAAIAVGQPLQIVKTIPGTWIEIDPAKPGGLPGTPLHLKADLEAMISTTVGNKVFPAGDIWVGNNGGAGWGAVPDTDLDVPSEPIPSFKAFGMGKSLLPYWDDFGNDTGDVYYHDDGKTLIIEWSDKHFEGKRSMASFQLQVTSNKEEVYAQMLYNDIMQEDALGGLNASIGYQDGLGGLFNDVQWSFQQPFAVENGMVLSLIPAPGSLGLLAVAAGAACRRRR